MFYQKKYLKYKNKYLDLKNQLAGSAFSASRPENHCIIGMGPVGLVLAIKLLELGHHVTLIETRPEFSRSQILAIDQNNYTFIRNYIRNGDIVRCSLPRINTTGTICRNYETIKEGERARFSSSVKDLQYNLFDYLQRHFGTEQLTIIKPHNDSIDKSFDLKYEYPNLIIRKKIDETSIIDFLRIPILQFKNIFACSGGNDNFSKELYGYYNFLSIPPSINMDNKISESKNKLFDPVVTDLEASRAVSKGFIVFMKFKTPQVLEKFRRERNHCRFEENMYIVDSSLSTVASSSSEEILYTSSSINQIPNTGSIRRIKSEITKEIQVNYNPNSIVVKKISNNYILEFTSKDNLTRYIVTIPPEYPFKPPSSVQINQTIINPDKDIWSPVNTIHHIIESNNSSSSSSSSGGVSTSANTNLKPVSQDKFRLFTSSHILDGEPLNQKTHYIYLGVQFSANELHENNIPDQLVPGYIQNLMELACSYYGLEYTDFDFTYDLKTLNDFTEPSGNNIKRKLFDIAPAISDRSVITLKIPDTVPIKELPIIRPKVIIVGDGRAKVNFFSRSGVNFGINNVDAIINSIQKLNDQTINIELPGEYKPVSLLQKSIDVSLFDKNINYDISDEETAHIIETVKCAELKRKLSHLYRSRIIMNKCIVEFINSLSY
jgi:hypothetical protein